MKQILLLGVALLLIVSIVCVITGFVRVPFYISSKEIALTVNQAADSLEKNYVFPEKGKMMADSLRRYLDKDSFTTNDPRKFGQQMHAMLRRIGSDRHQSFFFNPRFAEDLREPGRRKMDSVFLSQEKQHNYYIEPLEFLHDSIAYLKMDQMVMPQHVGERLDKIFDSLSSKKAVIIDLRENGGGEPEMVQYIISRFYKADTVVHLTDVYSRRADSIKRYFTIPHLTGAHMPNTRLYILTSHFTFSAAEALAYDLQQLRRAVIIGEVTGGGAHPGDMVPVGYRFAMFLPDSRAINPYSKTNWELIGVIPDINVPADKALDKALELARQ